MREVTVEDKYLLDNGTAMMTGIQALVRLPMLQRGLDRKNGLNTAGFISGYRGSPLGGYDLELWKAKAHLEREDVLFQPGVNEDLAATAVWGTQTLGRLHKPTRDGVFAIWYGKGPGVDRSGDPLRHGNIAGTHPNGGVLVVAGDDHAGKSSSIAHQSETALMHAAIPVLAPANVQDILDFGLLGFAMSRYTGLYAGLKVCNEVIEQTMTVEIPARAGAWVLPDRGSAPATGFHNYPSDRDRLQSEIVVKRYRLPLVEKFLRANQVNRILVEASQRKLGIVTAGKAVQDVRQALGLLGLDDAGAARLGVSVYKLGCVYPIEPQGLAEFARGQQELLFIEEKNPVVEQQAKVALYGQHGMPRIVGKTDEHGIAMIASDTQLEPLQLAIVIGERLRRLGVVDAEVAAKAQRLAAQAQAAAALEPTDVVRAPYFCSGCPHNTGTRFPEGSVAAGGIGCHAMAMYSGPEMLSTSHMGGEGAHWYGVAHFSEVPHIFQNMGDGTYYHSGLLAIRGAIAANVNMTFKILYNDAVAMTGGQPMDGPLTPGDISRQVLAEGVKRCVLVTDRPDLYGAHSGLGGGVSVHHRDEYDAVQRQLREVKGVTVVIYEQTCAAEKRRRRKRNKYPDPPMRMFINAAVCEGCGDCSVQSNCVSVGPKETELGRKREIDQSNCNKDYSCAKGFCPSFVTVIGAEPRKPKPAQLEGVSLLGLPSPACVPVGQGAFNIMISGIGGTGVVTVGALVGMAAHLEGKACSIFDMTGLSVKNGAVFSHVRIAASQEALGASKLGVAEADLALAFDAVAALSKEPAVTYDANRTRAVANARIVPVAAFQRNPDLVVDQRLIVQRLEKQSAQLDVVDATGLGLRLLGDAIAANLFLLGYACQRGLLPVTPEALERAIEINGVAIPFNKKAFALGRYYAIDPAKIEAAAGARESVSFKPLSDLGDIVAHRTKLLTAYQDAAYAERYQRLVRCVAAAEQRALPGKSTLAVTVARQFARLMAYKDEYEVARLYADPAFKQQIKEMFEDGASLRYNLAPPLLAQRDPETGHLIKRQFGPWVGRLFQLLSKMKGLRGTPLDIFGYTAERRMERALIDHYEEQMTMVAQRLTAANHAAAVELAGVAAQVRGFGHVKEANVAKARALESRSLERFHAACASPATAATATATAAA